MFYYFLYFIFGIVCVFGGRNNIANANGFSAICFCLLFLLGWPIILLYILSDCIEIIMESGDLFMMNCLKERKRKDDSRD